MVVELKVIIKDEESRKLSRDFLIYEPLTLSENDPKVQECVNQLLTEFKGKPDAINLKAKMVLT